MFDPAGLISLECFVDKELSWGQRTACVSEGRGTSYLWHEPRCTPRVPASGGTRRAHDVCVRRHRMWQQSFTPPERRTQHAGLVFRVTLWQAARRHNKRDDTIPEKSHFASLAAVLKAEIENNFVGWSGNRVGQRLWSWPVNIVGYCQFGVSTSKKEEGTSWSHHR